MSWSYRIGRVAGTEIKVHATFVLLMIVLAWMAWQSGGPGAALEVTLFVLALFACVLLHEFGHILMARRFGVRTPDVILLPIGGVARLERMPDEPKQELLIALAGPLVTLAIAVILYLVLLVQGEPPTFSDPESRAPFLARLMTVNVYLLAFNLVPAFPLDGGRVLRAVLAHRLGMVRGTKIAARIGQVFAVGLGLYALTNQQPILALIAFFVFLGAGAEASAVETKAAGRGLSVSQMMVTQFNTLPIYATLGQAAAQLLAGDQREFPVVDNLGRPEGILTRDNLIRGLSQFGAGATVGQAMTSPVTPVAPTLGFDEALVRLRGSGLPALPVVDGRGALVGLLTLDNVTDLLLVRRAAGEEARGEK